MTKTYTYNKAEEYEFMECADCAAKPGSPVLCPACYHNRTVIGKLNQLIATTRREAVEEIIEKVKHELKGSELFPLPERTDDISDEELKLSKIQTLSEILDQLPDKQEV